LNQKRFKFQNAHFAAVFNAQNANKFYSTRISAAVVLFQITARQSGHVRLAMCVMQFSWNMWPHAGSFFHSDWAVFRQMQHSSSTGATQSSSVRAISYRLHAAK
jgi:hypothetical protein